LNPKVCCEKPVPNSLSRCKTLYIHPEYRFTILISKLFLTSYWCIRRNTHPHYNKPCPLIQHVNNEMKISCARRLSHVKDLKLRVCSIFLKLWHIILPCISGLLKHPLYLVLTFDTSGTNLKHLLYRQAAEKYTTVTTQAEGIMKAKDYFITVRKDFHCIKRMVEQRMRAIYFNNVLRVHLRRYGHLLLIVFVFLCKNVPAKYRVSRK
jgi:hypothetical protein